MSSKCVVAGVFFDERKSGSDPLSIIFLSIIFAGIVFISGCGGSGATVNSVSITPSAASVAPGTQTDFTATVNLANATTSTSTAVTWEVNGIAGGNSTTGTIVSLASSNQLGVYTAPTAVPTTDNGQVNITAVAQQTNTSTSTTTATVTSNTAVVTISVAQGFSITPTVTTAAAGQSIQFSAILNGVTDAHATWSVASTSGGNPGTIGLNSGLYVAPLSPPTGNSITITGQDGTYSSSETITITFSDHSLTGPYSFGYSGDNQLGFYAVVGSFVTDGNGTIESGVEDVDSFETGVTRAPITGNYVIGPDGRGSVTLNNGNTWRFVLATNQHGVILRSDVSNTGSGTIDQQSVNALTSSTTLVSGPYAFSGLGADTSFNPLAMAGEFSADGAGNIPALNANPSLDVNDGGNVAVATSLSGTYSFDTNFPGTGRGTIILNITTATTVQREYAFYVVDTDISAPGSGTHLRLLEIDSSAHLAGDVFSGPSGNSFSAASLAAGNYVFKAGGNSPTGAYANAGLFASDGAGNMTSGAFDANNAGTVQTNVTLTACAYSVTAATGRIDLKLCGAGTSEYAVYQTAQNSAVMVEIDPTAISRGIAYQQQPITATAPGGNLALSLTGQGIFHNAPSSYQQDAEAQLQITSATFSGGNLDINNFNSVFTANPVNIGSTTVGTTTTPDSSIAAPAANGRGTAVITATNPAASYKLVYYLINPTTALLFDQDPGFILNGTLTTQF
jgi:hypothetical protein